MAILRGNCNGLVLQLFSLLLLVSVASANSYGFALNLLSSSNPIAIANGNSTQKILESQGGEFSLKFRSVGTSFVLAIVHLLYNETTVWSANRNNPVSLNATLSVTTNRSLILRDVDGTVVWVTNITDAYNLTLNSTGNLIISDEGGGVLWQSFDHPTDTLIPGQIVRAGTFLVSSVSQTNSSESSYMGGVLPGGAGFFTRAPEMFPYGILEFNPLRKSAREALVSLYNSSCNHTILFLSDDGLKLFWKQEGNITEECNRETGGNPNGFSITVSSNSSEGFRYIRMEPDGNLKLYQQTPTRVIIEKDFFADFFTDICRLPNYCGRYGICTQPGAQCSCPASEKHFSQEKQNCSPVKTLKCNSSHTMMEIRGVDYFPSRYLDPLNVTVNECKDLCLANCSCVAAFYYQSSGSCFHYEELLSMRTSSDQTQLAFLKVEDDGSGLVKHGKRFWERPGNIVGITLGAAVLAVILYFAVPRPKKPKTGFVQQEDEDGFLKDLPVLPPRFTYSDLRAVTSDFSRFLGSGGFGSVYEGCLADGTVVAVKQLEDTSQGYGEFRAEIATLASLSHVNLVRLRGFCAEESHHLLVYDYMVNRSLDGWLFSTAQNKVLNWSVRLGIAIDTARGLAFLHEESRECIVHLDVKPENILLDHEFRAKLSDFGLSKLIDRTQQSRVLTRMRGTPGYLAPEWLMETGVSSKSDIYSFGIVLLEMVAGRRCVDLTAQAEECYLPAATIQKFQDGRLIETVDPRMIEAYGMEPILEGDVRRVISVALWCIEEEPGRRPNARAVSRMLEGHMKIQEPPLLSLQSALARQRNIWMRAADTSAQNPLIGTSTGHSPQQ